MQCKKISPGKPRLREVYPHRFRLARGVINLSSKGRSRGGSGGRGRNLGTDLYDEISSKFVNAFCYSVQVNTAVSGRDVAVFVGVEMYIGTAC